MGRHLVHRVREAEAGARGRRRRVGVAEDAELQIALTAEIARGEYEGTIFALFVPLDAPPQ